jgi:hypothetical protein
VHIGRVRTTVVELAEFVRRAKSVMTDAEREALIVRLSEFPESGIRLGGGLWKLRVARTGGGKSGGYRVIHYYAAGRGLPVFLITVFAKNDKANLLPDEQAAMAAIGARIAQTYGRRS